VVRDDGVGFDPAAVDPDHYGLTGIQERAAMIGATFKVRSRPGGGPGFGVRWKGDAEWVKRGV